MIRRLRDIRSTISTLTSTTTTTSRPTITDIRDKGAINWQGGGTNNGPAFLAAMTEAKAAKRTMPFSLSSDAVGTYTIYVPPGDWVITDIGGLVGQENMTSKVSSILFQGAGMGVSNIIFKPGTAGSLIQNDYWLNMQFRDLGLYSATPGSTFFDSNTTHNAQRFQFISCTFRGWKYAVNLRGNNNNSEMAFINCHSSHIESGGAFFYIGASDTSDQFLNYWFYGCTHWITDAPFIDAAMGGHFHIYGLDASAWGSGLTSTQYLFNLRGPSHAQGVCNFTADGVRVEAKNAQAGLLYSEWPQGNVNIQVDWSSQTPTYTYGDIIHIKYTNVGGATYVFRDSTLAGGVKVSYSINDWEHRHGVTFRDTRWLQKTSPSDVVTYDASGAGPNDKPQPPVRFENCRGALANSVTGAAGGVAWDATIGYRGDLLQALTPRVLSVRGVHGTPSSGTLTVTLPQGALITDFEAISPAGAVSEANGGAWTLATTEGTPTTIATATVTEAMSAGYHVKVPLAVPFECNSSAKAKLTITPTDVGQNNSRALLLIKGYW